MFRLKSITNSSGFIGLEELIAAAIILVSTTALLGVSVESFKSFKRQREVATMIERENMIVGALQSHAVLESMRDLLQSGTVPRLIIQTRGTSRAQSADPASGDVVAINGSGAPERFYVDRSTGGACTSTKDSECTIYVDFAIRCLNQKTYTSVDPTHPDVITLKRCYAAYRVSSAANTIPLGAPFHNQDGGDSKNPAFIDPTATALNDFMFPISTETVDRVALDTCRQSAANPNNLFATGYDKNTGKLYCAQRTSDGCGKDQIATKMYLDPATNILLYECRDLKSISCPDNYALQRIQLSSLHPDSTQQPTGTCVFIGQKTVPWAKIKPDGAMVNGSFCTRNYVVSDATCEVITTSSQAGTCTGVDAFGNPTSFPCGPNVGTATVPLNGGYRTGCALIPPTSQPPGASWTGVVRLRGNCTLNPNIPETIEVPQ